MAEIGKIILAFAIAMALSISALTLMINTTQDQSVAFDHHHHRHDQDEDDQDPTAKIEPRLLRPSKRLGRFLAGNGVVDPRALAPSEQCNGKDKKVCDGNCMDLSNDDNNCGKCGQICQFTQKCCGGKCVYLAYDNRHCGRCNNRCDTNDCIYGLCGYNS